MQACTYMYLFILEYCTNYEHIDLRFIHIFFLYFFFVLSLKYVNITGNSCYLSVINRYPILNAYLRRLFQFNELFPYTTCTGNMNL